MVVNGNTNPTCVLVENNVAARHDGLRAYFVWGQGDHWTIRNNTVINSVVEHIIRAISWRTVAIYSNDFTNDTSGGLNDAGKAVFDLRDGDTWWIYNNIVHNGGGGFGPFCDGVAVQLIKTGLSPGATAKQQADAQAELARQNAKTLTNVIVRNNQFLGKGIAVGPGCSGLLFQDNLIHIVGGRIFDLTLAYDSSVVPIYWKTSNVLIDHNTGEATGVVSTTWPQGNGDATFMYLIRGNPGAITLSYNKFVCPKLRAWVNFGGTFRFVGDTVSSVASSTGNVWQLSTSSQPANTTWQNNGLMLGWSAWPSSSDTWTNDPSTYTAGAR